MHRPFGQEARFLLRAQADPSNHSLLENQLSCPIWNEPPLHGDATFRADFVDSRAMVFVFNYRQFSVTWCCRSLLDKPHGPAIGVLS